MRRLSIFLSLLLCGIVACGRQPAPNEGEQPQVNAAPLAQTVTDPNKAATEPGAVEPKDSWQPAVEDRRAQYEAALTDALNFLADQKWSEALAALETAQTFQDNEFIQGEITRVKGRMDQQVAAQKTVQSIETILEDGNGIEAAKLAKQALEEFGDGDYSNKLVKLRLQADALQAANKDEDAQARYRRYRDEGQAAVTEKNLRAAALAFEQALAAREDAELTQQLQAIRANLDQYDGLRKKASELRRDPALLDDALDSLREAEKCWPTLQLRQEIDEVSLAIQRRRDNVSVADFDVRGEIGFADAGRTFAEELLPFLKPRFDLVERGQIGKIVSELKLEGSFGDDFNGQRELGKLAKVRYLVVGSVSRAGGVTLNARLVETRSGLIVQTAKVTAPTAEEALRLVPELAKQLLMSDEEKLAYEQQQVQQVKRIEPIAFDAPLPPPPAAPLPEAPLPPPLFIAAPPPALGGLGLQHFKALPPPPPPGRPMPPPAFGVGVEVKTKLVHVALNLGDNLFRRGQYREAQRHFEFALQLSPGHADIGVRIERCAPYVPPPVVVVVERPVVIARPRVAVLDFLTVGDPRLLPPGLGAWTAQNIAPYFTPYYDVVEPAEVYWYMGRMGMTMRDLMEDPNARRWLARAVNVRFFVLGTVEYGSLDVNSYLLDAEFGFLQGSGRIVARNQFELKLRLSELAQMTMIDPIERARFLAEAERFDALVTRGRTSLDQRKFTVAVEVFGEALKMRPHHVQVSFYLNQARDLDRQFAWEQERQRQLAARLAAEEAARRRQWEMAQAAELARIRAAQRFAGLAEEQRRQEEQRRLAASNTLVIQARVAIKTKNFSIALNLFEGASGLRPNNDEVLREMAQARAEAERAAQLSAAQELALREQALRNQREQQLLLARQQLEQQRQRELAAAAAARKAQEDRDRLAYQNLFDEGQRLLNVKQYDGAIAALQAARRLKKTDAVEAMLSRAFADQAYALAEAKGKDETARLQQRLAEERERRKLAEQKAKANQDLYQNALNTAQQALTQKEYSVAQAKYQEAGQVFQTDAVITGLRQVQVAQTQASAEAQAAKRKVQEDATRTTRVRELVATGQVASDTKDYTAAMNAFTQAKKLDPDNLEVLTGLSRAEQGRERKLADARRKTEESGRVANFQRLLKSSQANLAAKQYAAASVALQEALKLSPDDAAAKSALAEAEKGRQATLTTAKEQDEAKKKTAEYQRLLADGRLALDGKRFDDAIKAFSAAQKVLPGDKLSLDGVSDAQKAKQEAQATVAALAKKRSEDTKRATDLQKLLTQARAGLASKDLGGAAKALDEAVRLEPKNADVLRVQKDLQSAQTMALAEAHQKAGDNAKRAASFQKLMDAGQKALKAKQYDQAATHFGQAAQLMPDDKQAVQLLQQAEKAAAQVAQALTGYQQAVARGEKALAAKKYENAIAAFSEAAKLMPDDRKAPQLLQQAEKAFAAAKVDGQKNQADYLQAIEIGQRAMTSKKYDDAVKAFTHAGELMPGDRRAAKLLEDAQRALRQAQDNSKNQVSYLDHLQTGEKALATKNYDAAIDAFRRAAKVMPGDQKALQLLDQAQKARDAAKTSPKVDPKTPPKQDPKTAPTLNQLLDQGQAQEKQQKYQDAIKSYQAALALNAKDKQAAAGLQRAELGFHVSEGQRHLEAKRYPDAVREFEAALVLSPNNPTVQKLLQKAKQGK